VVVPIVTSSRARGTGSGAQQQRIREAEDGGHGAGADGQRRDRHRGEVGRLPECSQREAEILGQVVQERGEFHLHSPVRDARATAFASPDTTAHQIAAQRMRRWPRRPDTLCPAYVLDRF
jgi:hypothetical protein